jgi:hypothetical protein
MAGRTPPYGLPFIHKYGRISGGNNTQGRGNENTGYRQTFSGQASGKKGAQLLKFMSGKARAVMQKADQWREQVSFYRFWNNEKVTEEALTQCMEDHCREQRTGLGEAVLTEDTSEMNLESHRKRIKDRAGLGTVGNGKDLGFFCHPTVVIEPVKQTVVGAIDLMLWARDGEPEGKAGKGKRPAQKPLEEKESYRRAERAAIGRERLSGVPKVTGP